MKFYEKEASLLALKKCECPYEDEVNGFGIQLITFYDEKTFGTARGRPIAIWLVIGVCPCQKGNFDGRRFIAHPIGG